MIMILGKYKFSVRYCVGTHWNGVNSNVYLRHVFSISEFFYISLFLNKFSTTFIVSVK